MRRFGVQGTTTGVIKGDTRSVDYSSYGDHKQIAEDKGSIGVKARRR